VESQGSGVAARCPSPRRRSTLSDIRHGLASRLLKNVPPMD
jgi:hypothetical protein